MTTAGVVLAGGQSSRYGQPKMFETFQGSPLYEYSLQALRANQLSPLIIATNEALQPYFKAVDCVFSIEQQAYQGPLAALKQIIQTYTNCEWFFVIASDMPYMNAHFVQTLLQQKTADYEAIVPAQADYIQPLAALYHRNVLPAIDEALCQNRCSMKAMLEQVRVQYVHFAEDDATFININRQQDWPKEL